MCHCYITGAKETHHQNTNYCHKIYQEMLRETGLPSWHQSMSYIIREMASRTLIIGTTVTCSSAV